MSVNYKSILRRIPPIFFAAIYMVLMSLPAGAAGYDNALKGVKNSASFNEAELAEVQKFQTTLKQMKKDGVTLEVCRYALKGMGVDEATIIPEVDPVDNGFVSVIGYQMQGYAVVRIP